MYALAFIILTVSLSLVAAVGKPLTAVKPCCYPRTMEGSLISIKTQDGKFEHENRIIDYAIDYINGRTAIRHAKGNLHVLMDHTGLALISVNGECVSSGKVFNLHSSRCQLCDNGVVIYSDYYGIGDGKLPFDVYHYSEKKSVQSDGLVIHDKVVTMSAVHFDNKYMVPVDKVVKFVIDGVNHNQRALLVGTKPEIADEIESFKIPAGCSADMAESSEFSTKAVMSKVSEEIREVINMIYT